MIDVNQRHSLGQILLSIKRHLASSKLLKLPKSAIRIIAQDNRSIPQFSGQRDILIRPGGFSIIGALDGEAESAGRVETRARRVIYVFLRFTMNRDEAGSSEAWLTDPATGILAFEDMLFNLLQDFHPLNKRGEELTTQGLQLTDGNQEEKNIGKDVGWGSSCIALLATYQPPIDPGPYGQEGSEDDEHPLEFGTTAATPLATASRSGSGAFGVATYRSEVPQGAIDGHNTVFTLVSAPKGFLLFFKNSLMQLPNIDFTLSANVIVMIIAPVSGDTLFAVYSP